MHVLNQKSQVYVPYYKDRICKNYIDNTHTESLPEMINLQLFYDSLLNKYQSLKLKFDMYWLIVKCINCKRIIYIVTHKYISREIPPLQNIPIEQNKD